MHTCKNCRHFSSDSILVEGYGHCALMGDGNDFDFYDAESKNLAPTDRCYGWDYEGYRAGTYVGKDFGCIHWEK